jgi:hypothetical protein
MNEANPELELLIKYNAKTGNMVIEGPTDAVLFYGMVELAKATFAKSQAPVTRHDEERLIVPMPVIAGGKKPF